METAARSSLLRKSCCCKSCSMWFCVVLLKYKQRLPWNRRNPWLPTKMPNLISSDNRTLSNFETDFSNILILNIKLSNILYQIYFKWVMAHRTWWRFWTMFKYGFLFAWQSLSWHLQIVLTCRSFWKYFWACLVMLDIQSCRWLYVVWECRLRVSSESPKTTGI